MSQALRVIKRRHDPLEVMPACVRWYLASPLSLRQAMTAERGVAVDHDDSCMGY